MNDIEKAQQLVRNTITLENARGYATEENLERGLDHYGLLHVDCRRVICRKPDGKWTAVFMISEYANKHGGYIGFASQHGFMSV